MARPSIHGTKKVTMPISVHPAVRDFFRRSHPGTASALIERLLCEHFGISLQVGPQEAPAVLEPAEGSNDLAVRLKAIEILHQIAMGVQHDEITIETDSFF